MILCLATASKTCALPAASAVDSTTKDHLEIASFVIGAKLFTDRAYTVYEVPAAFHNWVFSRASIEALDQVIPVKGKVVILSPTPRPGATSLETALYASGFKKLDVLEFQLFPGDINRVSGYIKEVEAGERVSVGKWGIVLFPPDSGLSVTTKSAEVLYNGIILPQDWPPNRSNSRGIMPIPYLEVPPQVIPIEVGRQLFVDDFLVESTTMKRVFHLPEKFIKNPILQPETEVELQRGNNAAAAPFGDGVFYDPLKNEIKLWYQAGWFDGTALATSKNGLQWTRPTFDVIANTNLVLSSTELRRDGTTIWLDHDTQKQDERFKMLVYRRSGQVGRALTMTDGFGAIMTSPDGVHWTERQRHTAYGDNDAFYYNPFRKKWIFSLKALVQDRRERKYWECTDFVLTPKWSGVPPVNWLASDELDIPDKAIGEDPQLYRVDAIAYESIMLGFFQITYGPRNELAASQARPKVTDVQIGFSRDGFHWDRPNRKAFIPSSRDPAKWDNGYVSIAAGGCLVLNDVLVFYYTGFRGDNSRRPGEIWGSMYANSATGVAFLRRDGFASMNAAERIETLTTRPVTFKGSWLFVNVAASSGELRVEILDRSHRVLRGFSKDDCLPITQDSTKQPVLWRSGASLARLAGQKIHFRFYLKNGSLYSFWVSGAMTGESNGYLAAGALGKKNIKDTKGDQ